MLLVCTRVLLVCYSYVLVCYWYVTGMSLVCTGMLLVCTRVYSYVTRMLLVCSFSHDRKKATPYSYKLHIFPVNLNVLEKIKG